MDSKIVTGVIPARMASSRFPGKPLIDLMGFPMIEHVWKRSKLCKQIDSAWKDGSVGKALVIQRELTPLYTAIFAESNPIGIKYAAYKLGLCSDEILLPLTFANKETRDKIDIELERLKDLEGNV